MIPRALPEIHAGDYGTVLTFEVRNGSNRVVDISGANAIEVLFMRPDGTNFSAPANKAGLNFPDSGGSMGDSNGVGGPGANGIAYYVVHPGDFEVPGQYFLQLYIEMGGGAWRSSIVAFTVYPNLASQRELLSP